MIDLLERGKADPNYNHLFLKACSKSKITKEIINQLIKYKADLSQKNESNETPFINVCKNENVSISSEIVSILLNEKVDLNVIDRKGKTGLHYAISNRKMSASTIEKIIQSPTLDFNV